MVPLLRLPLYCWAARVLHVSAFILWMWSSFSSRAKRGFYSGSAKIVWLQPILFAWLLKGRSCSSERARLHRWLSGWQTWLAIFKRTQSAYKPIDLLDLLILLKSSRRLSIFAHLPDHLLLLLYPCERCRTWISILWKIDTSYTVPVLANCTHSMALICNDKKWSLVVKSWLLAPSLTDRDRLLPHL